MQKKSRQLSVLVVEDNPVFARAVELMLKKWLGTRNLVSKADSLKQVRVMLSEKQFDVVLLDLCLPDSNIDNTLAAVHALTRAPLIVLTGQDDEIAAIDALTKGAQDYLIKGEINDRQLQRAINYAIERNRCQQLVLEKVRLYEQRDDFMATLAHDLKNPLIGANRILDLLTEGTFGKLTPQTEKLLLGLKDNNDELISMIKNLLEVHRFDQDFYELEKQNTNLKSLVQQCVSYAKPIVDSRNVAVEVVCERAITAPIEPSSMSRVIHNLMDNAIKFTPENGTISLRLWQHERTIFLQVSDSGPGIPDDERARLFERFFQGKRGKRATTGTGLGLYLCRQIVEAHHGKIWCESFNENTGATFIVSLPSHTSAKNSKNTAIRAVPSLENTHIRCHQMQ